MEQFNILMNILSHCFMYHNHIWFQNVHFLSSHKH